MIDVRMECALGSQSRKKSGLGGGKSEELLKPTAVDEAAKVIGV